MKIVALYREMSAPDYHRIILPLRHMILEEVDSLILVSNKTPVTEEMFADADVVVFNRIPFLGIKLLLALQQKYGFRTVMDLDDHWELSSSHILYQAWMKIDLASQLIDCLSKSDLVTVTHEHLAVACRAHSDNVAVLHNGLPFGYGQFSIRQLSEQQTIKPLYVAGNTHKEDLASIDYPLRRFGADGGQSMVLCGYSTSSYPAEWMGMYNQLVRAKIMVYPRSGLPLEEYMEHYSHGNVAIAPLAVNSFNRYKSNLKVLEAACKGLPCVAEDMHPYSEDAECKGLILCKGASEWKAALDILKHRPGDIHILGKALQDSIIKKYHLFDINQKRYHEYKNLVNGTNGTDRKEDTACGEE